MKRIRTHVLISAIVLGITVGMVGVVFAASVHFKNSTPVTDTRSNDKLQLTVCGALAGLGNDTVKVTVTASANPTATCSNPGNGNQAPGQNPAQVSVTGSQQFSPDLIKNGNLSFCVTTQPPAQPTWDQAGCANSNWTAQITSLTFTSYTVTVVQGNRVVLQQTF